MCSKNRLTGQSHEEWLGSLSLNGNVLGSLGDPGSGRVGRGGDRGGELQRMDSLLTCSFLQ